MARLFAWKPRWAMIMFVNSRARSTLLISSAPGTTLPWPAAPPGAPLTAAPELFEARHRLSPARSRPGALANFARLRVPIGRRDARGADGGDAAGRVHVDRGGGGRVDLDAADVAGGGDGAEDVLALGRHQVALAVEREVAGAGVDARRRRSGRCRRRRRRWSPAAATRKKPSPWIIMSVTTPVLWALPWVISVSIELSDMPEAHLARVGAAEAGRHGRAGAGEVLVERVLEGRALRLVAEGVDVRDVRRQHVHHGLVVPQAGHGREHGAHHRCGFPFPVWRRGPPPMRSSPARRYPYGCGA